MKQIEFELQTRDRSTGAIQITREKVDSSRIGVIAVDVWNYHWCKTATMRVDAFVPRINKALEAARSMGMTVMLCPSDVVDNYVGFPQREAVFALPTVPVPEVMKVTCPPVPDAGGCACGRERCGGNYGWDGMHPGLKIGRDDWMPDTQAEVYTICRQRKITHLIYVGFHTQVCLLGKPMGLRAMKSAGLQCVLARDMTDAHPGYDPARSFTPDLNTEQVVEHFEKHLAPTIHFQNELETLDLWDSQWIVDPVRIAPWGTDHRPHLFEDPITVTLTAPLHADAEIRYTTDGSEPTLSATLYQQPLVISESTRLRVSAFQVVYEVKPEYKRFVGLAGVDEYLISRSNGSNLAMHPSVVFKVFIDGHETAKSPVMRILSPAWRFDVDIPRNSKKISVIAMDAGDGSREDYADWANAGFIVGQ